MNDENKCSNLEIIYANLKITVKQQDGPIDKN